MARVCSVALLALLLALPACSFRVEAIPELDLAGRTDLGVEPDLAEVVDAMPVDFDVDLFTPDLTPELPQLTGVRAIYTGTVDLPAEGTIDWAHFGLGVAADVNRKAGGGSLIALGTMGTPIRWGGYVPAFSWIGGAPTASASTTHTGIYVQSNGNGFTITVPAGTTSRTLKLYLSVWQGTGNLVARLSDGSAPEYTNSYVTSGNISEHPSYALTFRAASAGQTLRVTWLMSNAAGGNSIDLLAAALY